jgi:pimeloyl-ACP methyl ester carboxylesterase
MVVGMVTAAGLVAGGTATAGTQTAKRPAQQHVVVEDITIPVPGQDPVQAWYVHPAGEAKKHSAPAVLWLHWLGEINNDRSEYLSEAVGLAGKGVYSVLPNGYFPWVPNPDGTTGDVTLVENQVAAFRSALDRLASERAVDPTRIALVGHDYGAMYGALLADSDDRISTMVLQAPDALMGNWFAQFWLQLEGDARTQYLALFDGLDPVDHTARLGDACCSSGPAGTTSSVRTCATRTPPPARTPRWTSTNATTTSSATTPARTDWPSSPTSWDCPRADRGREPVQSRLAQDGPEGEWAGAGRVDGSPGPLLTRRGVGWTW